MTMNSLIENVDTKGIFTIAIGVAVVWGILCYFSEIECADHIVQGLLESVEREHEKADEKERNDAKDDYY